MLFCKFLPLRNLGGVWNCHRRSMWET